jgi:hypothetical protein
MNPVFIAMPRTAAENIMAALIQCQLLVLLGNPGFGFGFGKILGFFELPVLVLVLVFHSRFQTGNFHFFALDLMSFYLNKFAGKGI